MQEDLSATIILIVTITSVLFALGIFVFVLFTKYHKTLREKHKEALTNLLIGKELERERLSRDLHDEMGSELGAIILKLDKIKTEDTFIKGVKQEAKQQVVDASDKIRKIAHDLMPVTLTRHCLVLLLKEMTYDDDNKRPKIEFASNMQFVKINKEVELHLYRIIKELITNTEKHSGATTICIDLSVEGPKKELKLIYNDNGKGFDPTKPINSFGIGLKNIATRVKLIKGEIKIENNNGFRLTINIKAKDYA